MPAQAMMAATTIFSSVRWQVGALGTAQTLSWGSTYYLPAVLATPMARDLGISAPTIFAAFSAALIVSAAVGPAAGRAIDRHGGRPVLLISNFIFALGLCLLSITQGTVSQFAAWAVMGAGMGCGLYEAAFATLVRLHGSQSRNAITGITLIAGFASTVGWPLSALFETQFGWRGACLAWAGLHLTLGLALNASIPSPTPAPAPADAGGTARSASPASGTPPSPDKAGEAPAAGARDPAALRTGILLSLVFAVTFFISTAMATHLPRLLQACGATLAVAVGVGGLIGPSQVAGRLLEFGVLRRFHPLLSARLAALTHPIGAILLFFVGAPMAAVFAILHGTGNGILTIAKGTLPLAIFGPQGYGARQGWLMMPSRVTQSLAPVVFGLAIDRWGAGALWLSAALALAGFAGLMALPQQSVSENSR